MLKKEFDKYGFPLTFHVGSTVWYTPPRPAHLARFWEVTEDTRFVCCGQMRNVWLIRPADSAPETLPKRLHKHKQLKPCWHFSEERALASKWLALNGSRILIGLTNRISDGTVDENIQAVMQLCTQLGIQTYKT